MLTGCLLDPSVKAFLSITDRICKDLHLMIHMNFPPDHPIEEIGRVLLALLIKYLGLEPQMVKMVMAMESQAASADQQPHLHRSPSTTGGHPKLLTDILKSVHQTKWKLVRLRQEQGKSYKEVCAPMIEKCRFLMTEVRPYYKSHQGLGKSFFFKEKRHSFHSSAYRY